MIGHGDALERLAEYRLYEPFLRQDSHKIFVVISDGDAFQAPHDSSLPDSRFISTIDTRKDLLGDWRLYGIYSHLECESADAIGYAYERLVEYSDGLSIDLCLHDFSLLFEELVMDIERRGLFDCRWSVWDVFERADRDPNLVNAVFIDSDGNREIVPFVFFESDCGSHVAWYYLGESDTPKEVALCPEACQIVQQGRYPELALVFSCLGIPI